MPKDNCEQHEPRPLDRHGKPRENGWLIVHGWMKHRGPMDGRKWDRWIPPPRTKAYHAAEKTAAKIILTEDEILKLHLIWHHLKKRSLAKARAYSLTNCLKGLLLDLGQTSEILSEIVRLDQSEALRSFDMMKGTRGQTRRMLDRARGRYLSLQAAREPDPIA